MYEVLKISKFGLRSCAILPGPGKHCRLIPESGDTMLQRSLRRLTETIHALRIHITSNSRNAHSGTDEDSRLPEQDAVPTGKQVPVFWTSVLPQSSG